MELSAPLLCRSHHMSLPGQSPFALLKGPCDTMLQHVVNYLTKYVCDSKTRRCHESGDTGVRSEYPLTIAVLPPPGGLLRRGPGGGYDMTNGLAVSLGCGDC